MTEQDEQVAGMIAAVESEPEDTAEERLQAAEDRLRDAEQRLGAVEEQLQAASARLEALEAQVAGIVQKAEPEGTDVSASAGRKTVRAGAVATLAKQGIAASALDGLSRGRMEAGSLDTALASLSIEQRFAVKSEMLRAGLL